MGQAELLVGLLQRMHVHLQEATELLESVDGGQPATGRSKRLNTGVLDSKLEGLHAGRSLYINFQGGGGEDI